MFIKPQIVLVLSVQVPISFTLFLANTEPPAAHSNETAAIRTIFKHSVTMYYSCSLY